jgi:hypothetical protein
MDLTQFTVDLTVIEVLLGIMTTAYAAMWGYRKFIKFANRS